MPTQLPHLAHFEKSQRICFPQDWLSGLEHHAQRRGQPFRNTTVLIPRPSFKLNFWILKISAPFMPYSFKIFTYEKHYNKIKKYYQLRMKIYFIANKKIFDIYRKFILIIDIYMI